MLSLANETVARTWVDETTDAELIAASIAYPTVFGEVFNRHYGCVYGFIARRLGPSEAADLASEVFLRAFRARHKYDTSRDCCRPWLCGFAYRIVGDRLRTSRRQNENVIHQTVDVSPSDLETAEDRLVAEPASVDLNRALSDLPSKDRDALLLYALEGLSYAQIATIMNIPPGTVGSRLSRARRAVRRAIPDLDLKTERFAVNE